MRGTTITLFVASLSCIKAISIPQRSEAQCALIQNSIYCYGGLLGNGSVIDTTLYSMPLVDLPNNKSMINLAKTWNIVNATNVDFILEPRRRTHSVSYNNSTLLITGGYTYNNTALVNQTVAYHADTNTWENLGYYTDSQGRVKQIYNSAIVSLFSAGKTSVLLYGGNTEHPTYNDSAIILTDSTKQTVMHQGYTSATLYDYMTKQWTQQTSQTNVPSGISYSAQTATLDPKTGLVYYLGGFYSQSSDGYSAENKMDYKSANVFNTNSGAWSNVKLSGTSPSTRMFPTATLLPNSNDILLFGGTLTGHTGAFTDFCYTLNLDTLTWTLHNINTAGLSSSPPRFAHSAVLVNTSLFIMFGLAVYSNPLNDVLVLSVNDVNNLYFPDTYPYIEQNFTKPMTNDTTVTKIASASLSTGATAGIAVAANVAGLGLCAAAIFFCIFKKKRDKKKMEEMSVDWDQVEGFYTAQPETEKYFPVEEPRYATPNAYEDHHDNDTKESTTVVSTPPMEHASSTTVLMKPSVIEGSDHRYVNQPIILKPDYAE
ncbi:hypothetical protein CU098_011802 [Rhizopus stolonifer]|uniref:Attractin/MKLN-like beta-propeller domain-containing protein n=1 Tax=Rhizopus stolonifer TaxID=4846 RepID=A0A367KMC4_RHIST|nr:hypothetical protein CU098_011802 [Rhizopus stolonifer]